MPHKKVVLITGTSSGLGFALSTDLIQQGFKVYATMRDVRKSAALTQATNHHADLVIKALDVTDNMSVERCVNEIIEAEGRIDILINNAGAGFVKPTEHASLEEIAWVMDINFMGVVRCTKAVLPHMRQASRGHIINLSSVGGLVGQPFNEIYCAAKFAVEGYTESLASYLTAAFNIYFTAIEPGGMHSEFFNTAAKQLDLNEQSQEDAYGPIRSRYLGCMQQRQQQRDTIFQTVEQVSAVITKCLHLPKPPVRLRTSDWANQFCKLKTEADPTGLKLQNQIIETMLGISPEPVIENETMS